MFFLSLNAEARQTSRIISSDMVGVVLPPACNTQILVHLLNQRKG